MDKHQTPKECPKCGFKKAIRTTKDIALFQNQPTINIPDNQYGCGACGHTWIEDENDKT